MFSETQLFTDYIIFVQCLICSIPLKIQEAIDAELQVGALRRRLALLEEENQRGKDKLQENIDTENQKNTDGFKNKVYKSLYFLLPFLYHVTLFLKPMIKFVGTLYSPA